MLTIETKPGVTVEFWKLKEEIPENWLTTLGNTVYRGSKKNGVIIGKLSEITEDQAKELVEAQSFGGGIMYKMYYTKESGLLQPYHYVETEEEIQIGGFSSAIHSLQSAAEEAGVKESEYNQYLIIKL
jgi:hypothetical protein